MPFGGKVVGEGTPVWQKAIIFSFHIYLFACSLICLFIYVSFNIISFSLKKSKNLQNKSS